MLTVQGLSTRLRGNSHNLPGCLGAVKPVPLRLPSPTGPTGRSCCNGWWPWGSGKPPPDRPPHRCPLLPAGRRREHYEGVTDESNQESVGDSPDRTGGLGSPTRWVCRSAPALALDALGGAVVGPRRRCVWDPVGRPGTRSPRRRGEGSADASVTGCGPSARHRPCGQRPTSGRQRRAGSRDCQAARPLTQQLPCGAMNLSPVPDGLAQGHLMPIRRWHKVTP
jgi:hypothetical protein